MGEGLNNEQSLMPYIHSCSIACGYHAGDVGTMTDTVVLAKKFQKLIGAHPSFPDREGFGRRDMNLPSDELKEVIQDQILKIRFICDDLQATLSYVKPHGALYNKAVQDRDTALAIVQAVAEIDKSLAIYTPFNGLLAEVAIENNIRVKYEVFGDRNYLDDLRLQSRQHPEAVIEDHKKVIEHVSYLIEHQCIRSITGKVIHVKADVVCIHGDNPNALVILRELHAWLQLA
jgi:5-oxoprolinase (ATP-hydrolysing) subunit A